MSTPSPVPLDDFDPVSPYAPKWAHKESPGHEDPAAEPAAERPHPAGIETDHDARILDEIEASLRDMIAASHASDESARLSDVSRMAAEELARQQAEEEERLAHEPEDPQPQPGEPKAVHEHPAAQFEMPAPSQLAADVDTVRAAFRDPRTPPWLLTRSLEPELVPEPVTDSWPRRHRRGRSNSLFLRFGLAATGAAVVAAIAIKDVPSLVIDYVRGPIAELSTNAAAVFNEGKASGLQARLEVLRQEQDRAPAPARDTVARADPQPRAVPVKTEAIARAPEPKRETVMTPWPSPDTSKRTETATWQVPPPAQGQAPSPAPASEPATNAASARTLSPEEIAMLRKMGDDYIAAGDFAGARAVLERAADAGDASAAFAIASTYDPVVLERFKVRGLAPDLVKAGFWYERARALGSSEAPHRLQAMMASRNN
jgi:hypothetical protein